MTPSLPVSPSRSTRRVWAGRIVSGLVVAFLAMDAVMKFFLTPESVKGTGDLGYPVDVIRPLGVLQLVLLALYLVPRTATLGALLWVGYLGGTVATHVRVDNPLFSHVLFGVYVAVMLWVGLGLRDRRVSDFFFGVQ